VHEEERGFGELELQHARLAIGGLDQIDSRIEKRPLERDCGQRLFGDRHFFRARRSRGDVLGREQRARRAFAAAEQRTFADRMTERAVEEH